VVLSPSANFASARQRPLVHSRLCASVGEADGAASRRAALLQGAERTNLLLPRRAGMGQPMTGPKGHQMLYHPPQRPQRMQNLPLRPGTSPAASLKLESDVRLLSWLG
jgi:hypothetical protein